MKKRLPIGNDDFAEVRRQNLYFIDKSLMIRDFLDTGDKVTTITRPRRFGKTLNMTMLREFLILQRIAASCSRDFPLWIRNMPARSIHALLFFLR